MAPSATSPVVVPVTSEKTSDSHPLKGSVQDTARPKSLKVEPLKLKGVLDQYKSFDITPCLGREFHEDVQLADLIQAENSDELLRDLAITSMCNLQHSTLRQRRQYQPCDILKLTISPHSLPKKCSSIPQTNTSNQRPPKRTSPTSRSPRRQATYLWPTYPSNLEFQA